MPEYSEYRLLRDDLDILYVSESEANILSSSFPVQGYDELTGKWMTITPAMIAANTGPKVVKQIWIRDTTSSYQGTPMRLYFWDDGIVTWKEER